MITVTLVHTQRVPKTASINGFADPIYDLLPDCAKECVKFSTSNTPCPYWDTGCFLRDATMGWFSWSMCLLKSVGVKMLLVPDSWLLSLCSVVGC